MIKEERDIRYTDREFTDLKEQLKEFSKNYFPDSYNDFGPTSPGTMFMEMVAYVGDILSFYQDTQLQETFLPFAKDPKNLYALAYTMGYRPRSTNVSEVELEVTQVIGATANEPDYGYAAILDKNSTVTASSTNVPPFLVQDKIDFSFSSSYDPTEITVNKLENGLPTEFLLTKKAKAFSGEVITRTFTIGTSERFKTLQIDDTNIVGVLDIVDSSGDEWYEVPYLGQDTVFVEQPSTVNINQVPYKLELKKVPKRFVTRLNEDGEMSIQFGAGTTGQDDSTFTPDPTNVGLGNNQGINKLQTAYDPSNFLYTNTYGIAPSNTTLTVRYIKGGGIQANAPANVLTQIATGVTAKDPTKTQYLSTVGVNNPQPASGGRNGDTAEELQQNISKTFAEQNRTVTPQDYIVRALSLPSKYGSISKAFLTKQDEAEGNSLSQSLYVLAYDNNFKLNQATEGLKQNLKTYLSQYTGLGDTTRIRDAFIVNFAINYDIVIRPGYNNRDVLIRCTDELIEYFKIQRWSINQPINLANIYSTLDKIKGVQTVQKIELENKTGGNYSETGYDIKGAIRNNIVYPSYDPMIFELKFPQQDIKGRVITL